MRRAAWTSSMTLIASTSRPHGPAPCACLSAARHFSNRSAAHRARCGGQTASAGMSSFRGRCRFECVPRLAPSHRARRILTEVQFGAPLDHLVIHQLFDNTGRVVSGGTSTLACQAEVQPAGLDIGRFDIAATTTRTIGRRISIDRTLRDAVGRTQGMHECVIAQVQGRAPHHRGLADH